MVIILVYFRCTPGLQIYLVYLFLSFLFTLGRYPYEYMDSFKRFDEDHLTQNETISLIKEADLVKTMQMEICFVYGKTNT